MESKPESAPMDARSCTDGSLFCRWGPEGGRTLTALFRRLRSPSAIGYVRS